MRLKNLVLRTLSVLFLLTALVSCDEDFQPIGEDLVGDINFKSDSILQPVRAYTKRLFGIQGVQTNGLTSGALGIYTDPIYGTTRASHLSQVFLSRNDPAFGEGNVVMDSVVFNLPYYSTGGVDEEGATVYELDSVYGQDPIKLSVYRSNYYLSGSNPPDITDGARYYSNQLENFSGIEGDLLFQVDQFVPSNEAVITTVPGATEEDEDVATSSAPALRLVDASAEGLAYWKQAIIDREGEEVLFNDNTFKDYFRGVYIKAEASSGDDENYFLFNRSGTNITIYYRYDNTAGNQIDGSLALNFYGTSESTPNPIGFTGFTNDFNQAITDELDPASIDMVNGEENIFLRGGQGATGVIELFDPIDDDGDGIPDGLNDLRERNILVREANLTFYVDQEKVSEYYPGVTFAGPERVYLYNLETNAPLTDYTGDASSIASTAVGSKVIHLGPLQKDGDGYGVSYKIRLTEYFKNLLNEDNEDPATTLGINVTSNVNRVGIQNIQNTTDSDLPNSVSSGSVLYQEGTILHGNLSSDVSKRLVLRIYYTELED